MSLVSIAILTLVAGAAPEAIARTTNHALAISAESNDAVAPAPTLKALVAAAAKEHQLSARLLAAIITVESGWNPWAIHLEPTYRYLLNVGNHAYANHVTIETERELQKMAWGLMQLVGGTARAIGYTGPLTRLLDPQVNVYWGARYLRQIRVHYPNVRDQVAAYNAGSVRKDAAGRYLNSDYVSRVTAVLTQSRPGGGLPH